VLVTGKGGVGRSTVTGALALAGQLHGRRVLLTEIADEGDDYSPLARHFQRNRLPPVPEELVPGVRGVSLLPRLGQELFLRHVVHSGALVRAALASETIRRLLSAGPSFREMGIYYQLLTYLRAKHADGGPEYEFVLVDMPATGHTLSLTGLPDLLLNLISRGPMADALREGVSIFTDPAQTAAWIITLPEMLPVSECLELLEGLQKNRTPIGGIVINRFPADPFTSAEREALKPLIAHHDVFGAEGFHRVDLGRRALARLRAGASVPLLTLPAAEVEPRHLISFLAAELERAEDLNLVSRPSEQPMQRAAP
jgi:anion-transporting  ArsA/GET3 family ATPase